ncbi:MAG: nucleotidyltransferase domain-containing protein [Nanoarchaeota archaeon]|nr:nucleotidyltransferase domain-containing protein [Nanoarchaeota archaeon]
MTTPPKNLKQELANDRYIPKGDMPELSEKVKKEMDAKKKELDKIKEFILQKYKFTLSIGIIPPQFTSKIEEEEPIPKDEKDEKRIHIVTIIPEDQFKNITKIKNELINHAKNLKPKIWFHVITPVDVWNFSMDSRYDLTGAIAMSYPLYDKGLLGALRVVEVHKNLVLRKFEKYVSSYVIAGSLVRGTATKSSDVDVFVIIDDTDVKRMPRLELREKLRGIIYQYIPEAQKIAGSNNKLEPQVYLLTDFWESVKDANPVMFTFIRDGIPLYDRGTFTPWKLLLQMGKIKPSPEAIDMFMNSGDKTKQMVNRRLMDAMIDAYWGILTPSQALLMLYGLPPPTHKETPKVFKEVFYTKEKIIEKKYTDILAKAVGLFKDYEHGKLKVISGKEIDVLLKETEEYLKRMKQLRTQIEKRYNKKTIEQIDKEIFDLLENLFNKKSKKELTKLFETELVKTGKMQKKSLELLKEIEKVVADGKKGKFNKNKIDEIRKNSTGLINNLLDYGQRCDFVTIEKSRMQLVNKKGEKVELVLTDAGVFLVEGSTIKKVTNKIEESSIQEFNDALKEQKGKSQININPKIFQVIKKEFGDFEIIL